MAEKTGQIELSLERAPWEIRGGTDGKLELFPKAETYISDEMQNVYRYWNTIETSAKAQQPNLIKMLDFERLIKMFTIFLYQAILRSWQPFPPLQTISISPEVKINLERDKFSRIIIDASVIEIIRLLEQERNYLINVFCETDVEVPTWTEIVISVHVEKRPYEEKMRLWELLEEKVRTRIEEIRKQVSKAERKLVDKTNENLAIRLEDIF